LLALEDLNLMMNALVKKNLFVGYGFGSHKQNSIAHLQFANDTILVGDKSWTNIRALKTILILFK